MPNTALRRQTCLQENKNTYFRYGARSGWQKGIERENAGSHIVKWAIAGVALAATLQIQQEAQRKRVDAYEELPWEEERTRKNERDAQYRFVVPTQIPV
jgi:hypothetical protein